MDVAIISAVISAIVGGIVGAVAGYFSGYYSAKRLDIEREAREEEDRLREDLLQEIGYYVPLAESAMSKVETWMSYVDTSSSDIDSQLVRVNPRGSGFNDPGKEIPDLLDSIDANLDNLWHRLLAWMPKDKEPKPYYYEKMDDAEGRLDELNQELKIVRAKVEPYLNQLNDLA